MWLKGLIAKSHLKAITFAQAQAYVGQMAILQPLVRARLHHQLVFREITGNYKKYLGHYRKL